MPLLNFFQTLRPTGRNLLAGHNIWSDVDSRSSYQGTLFRIMLDILLTSFFITDTIIIFIWHLYEGSCLTFSSRFQKCNFWQWRIMWSICTQCRSIVSVIKASLHVLIIFVIFFSLQFRRVIKWPKIFTRVLMLHLTDLR